MLHDFGIGFCQGFKPICHAKWENGMIHMRLTTVRCMIKAEFSAAGHIEGICCSGASVVDGTAQQGETHLPVQVLPRH